MSLTPQEQQELRELEELDRLERAAKEPARRGPVNAALMGANTKIANILGTPGDLSTAAAGYLGHKLGLFDQPLDLEDSWIGSAAIKRGLAKLGVPTYQNVEELNKSDRPFAVGGETLVGSVGAGGAAMKATSALPKALMDPVTRMIQTAPGRFAATELGLSAGSAAGAAGAEKVAPGNPWARAAGEVAGGFVNPANVGSKAYSIGKDNVGRALSSVSKAGRERQAANIVQEIVSRTGEDKSAIINALRSPDQFNLGLTSGQQTASPALLAVESRLAKQSPQFAAQAQSNIPRAFGELQQAGQGVVRTGDAMDLTRAAQERVGRTQGLARARAAAAQQQAGQAREQVGNVNRAGMTQASVEGREALETAMRSARDQEGDLWRQIPRDLPAEPTNVLAARQGIREELLPNETFPQPVETFTGGLARQADQAVDTGLIDATGRSITRPGEAQVTSGELLRLRNRALTEQRSAEARGDFQLARQMRLISEGALNDLNALQNAAIDPARAFSRELNQNFTQGFGGTALATDRAGAPRIAPETTLERAFGAGGAGGDVRMRQLEDAARFGGQADAMINAQDRFLRGAVQSAIDPNTGRVNPQKLAEFRNKNSMILERFPQLRDQLANAETAERAMLRITASTDKAIENAGRSVIAQIAGVENPAMAVTQILRGKNPVGDYDSLVRSASRAGPEAIAGLRSATLESVFTSATRGDGTLDFARLNQLLNKPASLQQGSQSLFETMSRTGVLDQAASQRLNTIIERAATLQRAATTRSDIDKLVGEPDMLSNFLQRVVGANIGGALGQGSGAPLVAAGAGSKLVRNFFDKLPAAKVTEILKEAANNPALMANLLEKPTSIQKQRELLRQLNGFLVNAGIVATGELQEDRRPLQKSVDAYAQ